MCMDCNVLTVGCGLQTDGFSMPGSYVQLHCLQNRAHGSAWTERFLCYALHLKFNTTLNIFIFL